MPLGYYKDAEKTARTFPVLGGVRYSVPGDRAVAEADGRLRLLGRASVTINTGGEKVFAEEVEHALKHHPDVLDAVVVGTPSERFGQQVTARGPAPRRRGRRRRTRCATPCAPTSRPTRCRAPSSSCDDLVRAPSGKADYRWAVKTAEEALRADG